MNQDSRIDSVWNHSQQLNDIKLTLKGHSRGSERSCFCIPELKLYFDAGIPPCVPPTHVFVTHGHQDHSGELAKFVAGMRKSGHPFPSVYVPEEAKHLFQNFMDASFGLTANTSDPGIVKMKGVTPGDVIELGKNNHFVNVYELYHGVPTRAYGLCQRRKKLNSKYANLDKEKIIKHKKEADFTIDVVNHLLAYVCDTTIEGLERNPDLLGYKYVVVECTFLGEDTSERHIEWKQLEPYVANNPDTHFILIHFSMRYKQAKIAEYFQTQQEYPNMTIWLN